MDEPVDLTAQRARRPRVKQPTTAAAKPAAKAADLTAQRARRTRTKPQKNAGATSAVKADDFKSDNEVVALTAVRDRLAEMMAREDIHERDFAAINKDYRKVIVELKEARERADAGQLGKRPGLRSVGGRSFDGDI